jgi:hypothetical protein
VSAWLRTQDHVHFSTVHRKLLLQVAHLPVCLWLRRQELVYFSSTADKSLMSQVAHFPVCLVKKARDKKLMSQVAHLPVCLVEKASDKKLMSQVAHLPVCVVEKVGRSSCTFPSQQTKGSCHRWLTYLSAWLERHELVSPSQQTRGSCHRWLTYLSAWLRRQELVYFSTADKRFMSQVAHLPVCLVEKTGAGVLILHSRQKAPSHHW